MLQIIRIVGHACYVSRNEETGGETVVVKGEDETNVAYEREILVDLLYSS